ncbi:hypothetical protein [Hymenobacter volaticus]|uniref:Uncharacterized protein n=1 Tax=Hymenobacter volaticus TaxID=2932254 RepID=A0ABY4GBR2_9BACT|nr:hypothetical protein [Hymenobacter volaticus]UOQ68337.1 hypothetical protein MUN86_11070 [Hymenobacter volaticus]
MSTIVAQLQHTQQRLLRLNRSSYTVADQHALQEMLLTTILELQALYFDTLDSSQRIRLLHCLSVLEQEIPLYGSPVETSLLAWQHLHESLLTCIDISVSAQLCSVP